MSYFCWITVVYTYYTDKQEIFSKIQDQDVLIFLIDATSWNQI